MHFYFSLQFHHLLIGSWSPQWPYLCPHHPVPTIMHRQALPAPEPGGLHRLKSENGFLTPPSANANVSPILFLLPAAWGFTMHPLSLWLTSSQTADSQSPKRSEAPTRQAWCHRLSELSSGHGLSVIPMVSCVYLLETIHV